MTIEEIKALIPHRYPFLLVDRVLTIEGDTITALKNVTANEEFFNGHFPGNPVMPGVLQVEALAQAACILTMKTRVENPKTISSSSPASTTANSGSPSFPATNLCSR